MKRIAALLSLTAVTMLAEPTAPTLPGDWKITGDVQGYPISESCTFKQEKEKISGPCKNAEGKSFDTTVTVADNKKVTLIHGGEYQGEALTLTFAGTFNEKGELNGTIDVSPMDVSGTFTATRVEAKPASAPTAPAN